MKESDEEKLLAPKAKRGVEPDGPQAIEMHKARVKAASTMVNQADCQNQRKKTNKTRH